MANPATSSTKPSDRGGRAGRPPARPVEVGGPRPAARTAKPAEEREEAQVGHRGVPQGRRADLGAVGVLGEHEDRRRAGHQLPHQQERTTVAGGRHQLHAERGTPASAAQEVRDGRDAVA